MFRASWRVFVVFLIVAIAFPNAANVDAQRGSRDARQAATSSALVDGAFRIEIHQTELSSDESVTVRFDDYKINQVIAVADITNLGTSVEFDPSIIALGEYSGSPLALPSGTPADSEASKLLTESLQLLTEQDWTIAENSTIRIALVFPVENLSPDAILGIRMGDQVMSVDNTIVEDLDIAKIRALVPTMELRIADITDTPGSGMLSVSFRDGAAEEITLSALMTPESGSESLPGCFYNEMSAATLAMSNGTVWLEKDGDDYLAWINNPSMGIFDLLNGRLVQDGFAGVTDKAISPYHSWLSAASEWAQSENTGLWETCETAKGDWLVDPTPIPVPTKTPVELRAEYQWIDSRDLAIRPGNFEGEKIAVAGSVFTILVDGNYTQIQIWMNGGSDVAVVIFWGDSTGIYEGTWITVYGVGDGWVEFTNVIGGEVQQPLILADIIDR